MKRCALGDLAVLVRPVVAANRDRLVEIIGHGEGGADWMIRSLGSPFRLHTDVVAEIGWCMDSALRPLRGQPEPERIDIEATA